MSAANDGPFECPVCGGASENCYRCSECGVDLADKGHAETAREGQ